MGYISNITLGRSVQKRLAELALLLCFTSSAAAGCGSSTAAEPCDDAGCLSGQRCVQDACRPTCATQDDCPKGQNCALYEFGDGTRAQYCVVLDYAKNGRSGQFEACQTDAECDTPRGFSCLDGECRIQCSSHFDCTPVGTCESTPHGTYCKADAPAKRGQYNARCPYGDADCDAANGFRCVGSGIGDLDAYCTASCASGAECPVGYRCGATNATPCADACNVTGQPGDGCVPTSEIGPGKAYECAQPFGLIRRVCVRNTFCSTCESDEDCLAVAGQICARDKGGQKICTTPCTPGIASCPWGAAVECGLWDSERGVATCAHRFGACRGTGKSCEPCVESADCGKNGYCTRSSFTGERFCVDLSLTCSCGRDADANGTCEGHGCPLSPGGLTMTCADTSIGEHCFGATSGDDLSVQTGCWPAP